MLLPANWMTLNFLQRCLAPLIRCRSIFAPSPLQCSCIHLGPLVKGSWALVQPRWSHNFFPLTPFISIFSSCLLSPFSETQVPLGINSKKLAESFLLETTAQKTAHSLLAWTTLNIIPYLLALLRQPEYFHMLANRHIQFQANKNSASRRNPHQVHFLYFMLTQ